MKFLTKPEELLGKQIAFVHAAQFADAITIGTSDGGIIMFHQDSEGGIHVKAEAQARFRLKNNAWMVKELVGAGVMSFGELEEWEREKERQRQLEHEEWLKKKEAHELAELKRLFGKYGKEALGI